MHTRTQVVRSVGDIAARQHGAVSWDQLLAAGASQQVVKQWLAEGWLRRDAPAVYCLAGTRDSWRRRVAAAVLDSGGWASHRTAAALHLLDGHPGGVIEVTVVRWTRSSRRPPYVIHESKDLRGVDLSARDGIACTSLPRTLIDLPAVEHPFRAAQALDHALRVDRSIIVPVRQRFLEVARRGRNGTRAMRRLLNARDAGYLPPGSSFEDRMLRLLENLPLPKATKQVKVVEDDFTAFIDIGWPAIRFGIECDSLAHHFGERAHQWDRTRRRRLKALGWEIVEFTYDDVTKRATATADEILHLYRQRETQVGVLASTMGLLDP